MKRRKHRILRWLAIAGLLAFVLCVFAYIRFRQAPAFYRLRALSAAQLQVAADSIERKLLTLQNFAAQTRADEAAARRDSATLPAEQPITLTVTQDELNAFLQKWSVWPTVKNQYAKFLEEPYIALEDDQLILAGKLPSVETILSAHFTPGIDADGRLRLTLSGVYAGRLPFPMRLFASYRVSAEEMISRRMAEWRARANVDRTGVANSSLINAVMGSLVNHALEDQSSDPVLFLPLVSKGALPVRVLSVKIEDHTLTLVVEPMTPTQRQALVEAVRGGRPIP